MTLCVRVCECVFYVHSPKAYASAAFLPSRHSISKSAVTAATSATVTDASLDPQRGGDELEPVHLNGEACESKHGEEDGSGRGRAGRGRRPGSRAQAEEDGPGEEDGRRSDLLRRRAV